MTTLLNSTTRKSKIKNKKLSLTQTKFLVRKFSPNSFYSIRSDIISTRCEWYNYCDVTALLAKCIPNSSREFSANVCALNN